MFYHRILEIQKADLFFNRRTLSIDDLARWSAQLGAQLIANSKARHPTACWESAPVIRYNPLYSEALQILTLGHEIGHVLFGHIATGHRLRFSIRNLFTKEGWEREASLVGYLALIPTPELIRMARQGIQGPEELFAELQPLFGDNEKLGMQVCIERIRIFNRLLEICGGECLKGGSCQECGEPAPKPRPSFAILEPADIPTVRSPFEVEPGAEYRFTRDPAHIIRLRWKHPAPGRSLKLLARNIAVAGISFDNAKSAALPFISGEERSLQLVRDPENPFDPNAIKVIGRWRGGRTGIEYSEQIGWVPKRVAARLADKGPNLYAIPTVLFQSDGRKGPGVRFDIWQ